MKVYSKFDVFKPKILETLALYTIFLSDNNRNKDNILLKSNNTFIHLFLVDLNRNPPFDLHVKILILLYYLGDIEEVNKIFNYQL